MSRAATAGRNLILAALTTGAVWAQATNGLNNGSAVLDWRRVGLPSIDLHLASAASGPVTSVWYASGGSRLLVQTASGAVFQTADFENWSRSDSVRPQSVEAVDPIRLPELQSRAVTVAGDTRRVWAVGQNVYESEDGGRSWRNVTAAGSLPVIGGGQKDIAVDPTDSSTFAVANQFGVWQTHDEGRTWNGLNDNLPNLPVARILAASRGAMKIALSDGRTLQLSDARGAWALADGQAEGQNAFAAEAQERVRAGASVRAEITAWSKVGDRVYAGSSDGRVWTSFDGGATWSTPQTVGQGAVRRFFVDSEAPRSAIAVLSGAGAHVARTVNGGTVWDDVTGNLGDAAVNAATADRASGTAFLATDRGVYTARLDLNAFAPVSAWTPVSRSLPVARAVDVALDSAGTQIFVALDGYGLYSAPAPQRGGSMRIANAADFSNRPAAPGSVISIVGGKVTGAKAGDLNFPVLAARDNESQLQVPFQTRTPAIDLEIQSLTGVTTLPLAVRNVSPAIFIDRDGSPFLVDADTGLAVDASSSAHPGTRLQLMVTGLGRVQPDWPTGTPAPSENPPSVTAAMEAFLDGVPVEVTKATLAPGYVGYYLVEVQLPTILNSGPAQLYLRAEGQESNKVRVLLDAQ